MYRIGEFSYLFKVTLKTLRHYDKIGLFSPKKVDKFTGYRYYDDSQIEEFKKILLLKELDFSLDDIKVLKDNATDDFINQKLLEVNKDVTKSRQKIQFLQSVLNDGGDNMKYKVGFITNPGNIAIGKYVTLKSRDDIDEELRKIFEELRELKEKNGINDIIKVYGTLVINEEIGYKEEDIEMFLGYIISNKDAEKYREYFPFLKENGFIIWRERGFECLAIIRATEKKDIPDIYSNIVKYAKDNNVKVFGPFHEEHYGNEFKVYIQAHDENRKFLYDLDESLTSTKKYNNTFKNDPDAVGTWKIKEILPGIKFNPNKQKSIPDTKFEILELKENGKTNYDNITWTRGYLIIENDNVVTYNLMSTNEVNGVTYLFIYMKDAMVISSDVRAFDYIYEKINN